jgi:hypothetical protein
VRNVVAEGKSLPCCYQRELHESGGRFVVTFVTESHSSVTAVEIIEVVRRLVPPLNLICFVLSVSRNLVPLCCVIKTQFRSECLYTFVTKSSFIFFK